MKDFASLSRLVLRPLCLAVCAALVWGCKGDTRQDTLISSVANPSRTYRATIVQRQYFIDGRVDTSPTTYVLLDEDAGKPGYENGEDFKQSEIVMQPSQCGPLTLTWEGDRTLKITCEKCGLAQSALGPHPRSMNVGNSVGNAIRIDYEGFPDMSSWETAPRTN